MLDITVLIGGILLLAVALPIIAIAWVRAVINLFRIASHLNEQALAQHPSLRWNKLNVIFFPEALDHKGKKARNALLKNICALVLTVGVVIGYTTWAGLVTT